MSREISGFAIAVAVAMTICTVSAQRVQSQGSSAPRSTAKAPASQPAKKQYVFQGTVERVDAATGLLTVRNENIPGWMGPMSMSYHVDTPAVLKTLKQDDRITATVYQGDTSKLYHVRVVATPKPAANALPPISYVCPSQGEGSYINDAPGKCPKSGADLVPVRLDIAYKCIRMSFIQEKPGVCPMDKTPLGPVTASIFWICPDAPDKHLLEPGTCNDGSAREKQFEVRPHGDHNPRHGGPAVFMSPDQFHHVEATLVESTRTAPTVFRVYFYDEYTRPISAAGYAAQVMFADQNDTEVGQPIELAFSKTNRDGNAMEARIPGAPVPSEATPAHFALHVKPRPVDKDWRTDYQFREYSKEPPPLPPTPAAAK